MYNQYGIVAFLARRFQVNTGSMGSGGRTFYFLHCGGMAKSRFRLVMVASRLHPGHVLRNARLRYAF
jgi:hypothetical protein